MPEGKYTNNLQEAAEILAGHTGYDTVMYRGKIFRRSVAVAEGGRRQPDGSFDISVSAAKQYIRKIEGKS